MSLNPGLYSYTDQPTSQRQITTNLRTYIRNVPSSPLQPYLNARPVDTKFTILPIVDPRAPINVPLIQQATFMPEKVFNPGNDFGPYSGYASNVNRESELRNQIYAIQSCPQAKYIPSSKSDLYNVHWQNQNIQSQPFPDLFKPMEFCPTPQISMGHSLFNNATRQQINAHF